MPLLQFDYAGAELTPLQAQAIQRDLTALMAEVLHKAGPLTVVAVRQQCAAQWSVGGGALQSGTWTASLVAYITAGTNSEAEVALFIERANQQIREVLGEPVTPLYVVVCGVDARHWGYDGRTQLARRVAAAPGT